MEERDAEVGRPLTRRELRALQATGEVPAATTRGGADAPESAAVEGHGSAAPTATPDTAVGTDTAPGTDTTPGTVATAGSETGPGPAAGHAADPPARSATSWSPVAPDDGGTVELPLSAIERAAHDAAPGEHGSDADADTRAEPGDRTRGDGASGGEARGDEAPGDGARGDEAAGPDGDAPADEAAGPDTDTRAVDAPEDEPGAWEMAVGWSLRQEVPRRLPPEPEFDDVRWDPVQASTPRHPFAPVTAPAGDVDAAAAGPSSDAASTRDADAPPPPPSPFAPPPFAAPPLAAPRTPRASGDDAPTPPQGVPIVPADDAGASAEPAVHHQADAPRDVDATTATDATTAIDADTGPATGAGHADAGSAAATTATTAADPTVPRRTSARPPAGPRWSSTPPPAPARAGVAGAPAPAVLGGPTPPWPGPVVLPTGAAGAPPAPPAPAPAGSAAPSAPSGPATSFSPTAPSGSPTSFSPTAPSGPAAPFSPAEPAGSTARPAPGAHPGAPSGAPASSAAGAPLVPPAAAPAVTGPVASVPSRVAPPAGGPTPGHGGRPGEPLPTLTDLLAARPAPPEGPAESGWQGTVRRLTGGLVAPPPGRAEQARRAAVAVVQRSLEGPKTVVVINPKGGAHKTTATMMLAATFGLHRGGYTLAWDNNETRGTLGWRSQQSRHHNTAVNLLQDLDRFDDPGSARVGDLDNYVRAQGSAQFDVLASDEDAASAASIDAFAFRSLHRTLSRFYRVMVVDTGNNMRASNWQAAVEAADQVVIVSTVREDTAQSAAWAVDALRATGHEDVVRRAVTVLSAPAAERDDALARRLHEHFGRLTRTVLDVPYDPSLVAGRPIDYDALSQHTRDAWLHVTAAVAEGL